VFSLSFVLRKHNRALIGRLVSAMVCVAVAGIIGMLVWDIVHPFMLHWIPQLDGKAE
jgi:hypothetical protein